MTRPGASLLSLLLAWSAVVPAGEPALDGRHWRLRGAFMAGTGYEYADAESFRAELFAAAGEVAAKLGAK